MSLPGVKKTNIISNMKVKDEKEWMLQARSDLKNADGLLKTGRYIGCVFFCHLAMEKSLKAVFYHKFKKEPPKTHNLTFLVDETGIEPPHDLKKLIARLATASVPTRYPEDLRRLAGKYTKGAAIKIFEQSKEVLKWISDQLNES